MRISEEETYIPRRVYLYLHSGKRRLPTMSSKPSTSKRETKLPMIETIITRHKAAQLKRELRSKTQHVDKPNQLSRSLKRPEPSKVIPPNTSLIVKTRQKRTSDGKFAASSPKKSKDVPKLTDKRVKKRFLVLVDAKKGLKEAEFYPNRLKRKIDVKKVLLKPKHELKLIGSKRKKVVPRKGINSSEPQTINQPSPDQPHPPKPRRPPELSVKELVRLTDETDLNDEDFLEILTCPSPVWWEDPPDSEYFEDAIFTRDATPAAEDQKDTSTEDGNLKEPKNQAPDNIITEAETEILVAKQADEKFMKKRTKLDQLLRNIRNKVGDITVERSLESKTSDKTCILTNTTNINRKIMSTDINTTNANPDNNVHTDDNNISHNDRIVTNTECSLENNHTSKVDATENPEIDNEKIREKTTVTSKDRTEKSNKNDKPNSESAEGEDTFFTLFNDDLLNDLENMDIPMENDKADCVIIDDIDPCSSKSSYLASGEYVRKFNPMIRITSKTNKNLSKAMKIDEKVVKQSKRDYTETDKLAKIRDLKIDIASDTASNSKFTITSIHKEDMSSPLSMKSQLSDYTYDCDTSNNQDNLDTISDINIRYINDDDSASVSSKCSDKQSETCTSPNNVCVSERIDSKSVESENCKQFFLDQKQNKTINGPLNIKTIDADMKPKNITDLKTANDFPSNGKVIKLNAKLSNSIKLKPIKIRPDLSKIRIISKFTPSTVATPKPNNLLTNIKATTAGLKLRQTEVPSVMRLKQGLPLKIVDKVDKTNDPPTANCEIVKDKVDIMSVYKIICKDKFPLNNGPKSTTGNEDNFTSNKADLEICKDKNNMAYEHKEIGYINTKNVDTNTKIADSDLKNDNTNVNNGDTNVKNAETKMTNGDTNMKSNDSHIKNGDINVTNVDINLKNSEVNRKTSANTKNGDTNVKNCDTNVKNGDTNVKNGDTNVKNGDTNVKNGDTNVKNGDTNVKNGDTNMKNVDIFVKKYTNVKKRGLNNPFETKQTSKNTVDTTEIQTNTITNEATEMNSKTHMSVNEAGKCCDKCDPNTQKSIAVPNSDKVKYCLKCSSIFDTEDCAYCLRKIKNNENGPFECQTCDMTSCCMGSFNYHQKWHECLPVKT